MRAYERQRRNLIQNCNSLYFNQCVRSNQSADHDSRRCRPWRPLENLAPDLGGFLIVLKRQDIIGRFDNICQIAAGKLQDYCEFPENLPCLRDDVAFADHHAFVVGGRRTERKMKFPTRTPGEKVNDFGQLGFGTSGW